jgi:hypothetical protein
MKTSWYDPKTKADCARYDKACQGVYAVFGSYPKIAAAIKECTGEYIAAQTVRLWFQHRKIPVPYVFILAAAMEERTPDLNPFDLVPWLRPHVEDWLGILSRREKYGPAFRGDFKQ